MQEIRLTKMRICNFKGIRELEIAFNGKDLNIRGDNGTGKTTIIDSFTWLLFGKDSLGRADFGIKPTDIAGNIIHQLETSVEAVFDISGTTRAFKKTLTEIWSRRRGAAEAEFAGNENSFYIDGVPKKKSEYTATIKALIDEDVFKIVTNPLYFNESVSWRERRSVLLTICGEVSDEEVIASNNGLAPLTQLLEGKAVSDFKDITLSQMKRINQELDMIPVKINEAELARPSEEALEVDLARKEMLTQEIEQLRVQRSNIQNGTEALQARQKVRLLKQELSNVNKAYNLSHDPLVFRSNSIDDDIRRKEKALIVAESDREMLIKRIEAGRLTRSELSKEWDEVFAERFTGTVCPTCGRDLAEDEIEAKTKEFNRKKALKLDDIEKRNAQIGANIEEWERTLAETEGYIASIKTEIERLKEELTKASEELTAHFNAVSQEQEQESQRIKTEIEEAEALIRRYEDSTEDEIKGIDDKIATLTDELNAINEAIANKALLEKQNNRIAELREQQQVLALEYTKQERNLYLCEQFIIAKVNMLNERINQKFKYAKFKLFDRQINGGINEVCEVTYNGIAYKDLNNAMKVNIGLDVINTISAHYGVTVPIMIDNCESVNVLYSTNAQQIRFYVSEDKKLVFEY